MDEKYGIQIEEKNAGGKDGECYKITHNNLNCNLL